MKIVFMGTPEFAVPSLQALIDAGHEIALVVTQPDKKGNRNKVIPSPVKLLAEEKGLPIAQPFKMRKDEEFIAQLREIAPDMIIVAAFGQILPKSVLDIPRYGCINVHGSLLPDLRGASPMQTAVRLGYKETGVTIMQMAEGLDTGDMISKVTCNIEGMDIVEVTELLAKAGAELLAKTIPTIEDGSAVFEKQDDAASTYASMMTKADGETDFNEDAWTLLCKMRAFAEWPTLYSYLDGLQVKFFRAEALTDAAADGEPGTVSEIGKDYYTINCAQGKFKVYEQQLQGKKRMGAGDFMRGHHLQVGDRFTKNGLDNNI